MSYPSNPELDGQRLVGEQLRLARMAHGYALEDVGDAVAASRQYVHQLETGATTATGEMTLALAEVLGVTPAFLRRGTQSTVRPEQCHFRKQLTTPAYVTSQVLARATLLDLIAAELDSELELPVVNYPDLPVDRMEEVEAAAEEARRYWSLGAAGPIRSMMRVVENAGAIVTYFGDLSERVDAFSMDRRRPLIVRSSLKESLCRQRFDLAHECGHLIMHRGVQTGDRVTEDQAHRFATAFLIPLSAMITEFPKGKNLDWRKLYELKLRWKVSVRAIVRRAYDLGLISSVQYRTANVYMSKRGHNRVEPYDDELPIEQPELLSAALEAVPDARWGSMRSFAERVGLDDAMFKLITGVELPPVPTHLGENVVRFSR